jgi:hypothetical protein
MSVPDFVSNAAEIARRKLARDVERIEKRPSWLPPGHPDGEPFIGFGIPHDPTALAEKTEGPTLRHLTPEQADAAAARLSDAQVEGFHVEAQVRQRNDVARHAAALRAQLGGES